ncbi:hypothetical protein D0868_01703 [Hortaea werneckii]|uniref:F-box domain-containing protein n=1 Tax=Hortaea werneckii TaxID=91943 RepID=A0A3M6ZFW6_HORWE|nr:hypothetical protein D0868_01703 [Hortaea werneckii]
MQDLVTLPRDIKHYILQFLTDQRDLYNLNLTCQELRHDALPFYYNTVHVIGNVALPVLAAGLVPTNPGLQHLRHLVIKEPYCDDPIECQCQQCPVHSNTDTALTLLANLLPYDCLLTFTCDCVLHLPFFILATLYRRQPKLRTLRLDSFHLDPVIASLSQGRLANIATVYICTSDPSEASLWNRVLPTLSNLRNLEVIAAADRFDGVYPLTADASSEVLAKLLDWTSQKSHYKPHLHTLQVQGFDLTDAAETLRRHIHFPGLQVLGIQFCPNSVRLVEILYETHELGRLSLRTLILVEAEKSPEFRLHNPALSRLLSTFDTLEHLFVRAKGSAAHWPDLPAVAGHAASLRLLHLDCLVPRSSGQQRRGSALQKLHKLEQFALPMSGIDLVEAGCCATAPCYREMRGLLTCLNALPSLRTLQMLDMRLYDLNVRQDDRELLSAFVLRHTRTLADYVFNAMAKLNTFSFGRLKYRHSNINRWESCSGQCYHLGRTIDARGREQITAIEASLQELKQIEPAVNTLDMGDLEHGGLFRYGYEL